MSDVLRNKYRPKVFDEFLEGQGAEGTIEAIENNLGTCHVYLFHGTRGCGKTTLARLVASALEIDSFDINELDAATNRGIDQIRELKRGAHLRPISGERKMYIIDEAHALTGDAKDALLKTLEEPPEHCFFVLCTTNPGKLSNTIRRRAKTGEFEVKPLTDQKATDLLNRVLEAEERSIKPSVHREIRRVSDGIPSDLLSNLEKVWDMDGEVALNHLRKGLNEGALKEICEVLVKGAKDRWPRCRVLLKDVYDGGADPEEVRRFILGYLNSVLMSGDNVYGIALMMDYFLDPIYDEGKAKQARLSWSIWQACWKISADKE